MRKKRTKNKIKYILFITIAIIIGILIYRQNQTIIVCLDAGHGGHDAGSLSSNGKRYEKDDNLKLVLKVKEKLEKQKIKVILTRKDDTFVSLEKRCQIANWKRVDLFVSIHRNSSKSGDGVEIWISKEKNEISEKLANDILQELEQTKIQSNRGVKSGTSENNGNDYFVNKATKMPSCLIELGFISNQKDNELFDENLEEYARSNCPGDSSKFRVGEGKGKNVGTRIFRKILVII